MVRKRPEILIVDDEETILDLVCEELAEEGYLCEVASNADDALTKLKTHNYDVVLLDIILPEKSGMDILKIIKECYQTTAVVMMTAVKDLDTAVETMKLGASDYIIKPFTLNKLKVSLGTVLKNRKTHCAISATISETEGFNLRMDTNRSLSEMNAIADGVSTQVDYFDFHSKIVTHKTITLARWLGLPEKEIEKWAVSRYLYYSERERRIESMLNKLERNPMAQAMLGLTRLLYQFPNSGEE